MSRTEAEETVDRFLASWHRGDVDEMLRFFTDDAVWHNMPMEPVVGIDSIRKLLLQFAKAMDGMRVEVHRQLSDGTFVMNERTDHLSLRGQAITLSVCGVFEIENGRIKSWRDYFDMTRFSGQ